jgi:hypothetical protein
VHAQSDFVVLLYATAPPSSDEHGMATHVPAMHDSSVSVEVTIAVSPPVLLLHGGNPEGVVVSMRTVKTPFAGSGAVGAVGAWPSHPAPATSATPDRDAIRTNNPSFMTHSSKMGSLAIVRLVRRRGRGGP